MVVRYVEIAAGLIQSAESLKSAIFGINFPKGVLLYFYQIWRGVGSARTAQSREISPLRLLKCQIVKIGNFSYKFAKKGYTPLSNFYKIWLEGGSPRFAPSPKFYRFGFVNVGLQPENSLKLLIFGIYLPHKMWRGGGSAKSPQLRLRPPKSQKIAIFG